MSEQEQERTEKKDKPEIDIKELIGKVSETNRKIEEAYDEKLKRLEAKKKLLPDEKEEEKHMDKIVELKEKLTEVRDRISKARKAGKDPLIADLMLRNVNAKIKMAEVTHEGKDFKIVENILNNAELELKEALKQEELNVKKEIETKLREYIAKETGKATNTVEEV